MNLITLNKPKLHGQDRGVATPREAPTSPVFATVTYGTERDALAFSAYARDQVLSNVTRWDVATHGKTVRVTVVPKDSEADDAASILSATKKLLVVLYSFPGPKYDALKFAVHSFQGIRRARLYIFGQCSSSDIGRCTRTSWHRRGVLPRCHGSRSICGARQRRRFWYRCSDRDTHPGSRGDLEVEGRRRRWTGRTSAGTLLLRRGHRRFSG